MSSITMLYLLKHKNLSCFKIGVAINICDRAVALGGLENFNWQESYSLELSTSRDAYKIENMLHYLYNFHNVKAPNDMKCGLTEWFDIICFDDVLYTLKQFMVKLNIPETKLQDGLIPPTKKQLIILHKKRKMTQEEKHLKYLEGMKSTRKATTGQVEEFISTILSVNDFLIEKVHKIEDNAYSLVYTNNEVTNDLAKRTIFSLCGFSYKEGCGYIGGINILTCTSGNNKFCTIQLTNLNIFFNREGFENIKLLDDFLKTYALDKTKIA